MTKIHKFLLAGTVALLIVVMASCSREDRADVSGEVTGRDISSIVQ